MLLVNGHGSHLTQPFLDWCWDHKILLCCFPPHTTHRLQPLDIGIFLPLATYYSQELDESGRLSEGVTIFNKADFFPVFWPSWEKALTKQNISSAWAKSGIWPFKLEIVLRTLKTSTLTPPSTPSRKRAATTIPETFTSPRKHTKLRTIVNSTLSRTPDLHDKSVITQLKNTLIDQGAKLALATIDNIRL